MRGNSRETFSGVVSAIAPNRMAAGVFVRFVFDFYMTPIFVCLLLAGISIFFIH